jgi:hypothetical protein
LSAYSESEYATLYDVTFAQKKLAMALQRADVRGLKQLISLKKEGFNYQ